ncbi:MAG TPA: multifunctional oxoglutarate decarboxylase/oxoglutarate dehydrogenase thiamine pyrophosphate-binding subunit/dihydrolipoyllysine-residue succinyltransferase subunit [Acidimicrobiia bacterium]
MTDAGSNDWLIEDMRERYLADPDSVSESWRAFFEESDQPGTSDQRSAVGDRQQPSGQRSAISDQPEVGGQRSAVGDRPEEQVALPAEETTTRLTGIMATIARRMEESLAVPTATSFRTMPSKLLEVNRLILNNQLKRLAGGGKVSFTHLIGYAVARALGELTALNVSYAEIDGKPHVVEHPHVNLGLAIDVERADGTRVLLVPNIKAAETFDFKTFWEEYELVVTRARNNKLSPDDFAGTTATLTNPGTIGTVQSVPRLMPDQGLIVGVGAIGYPSEYQAADPRYLARQGIGKVITLTSTYDHRVIQGAQSGELLRRIHQLLLGEDGFYDQIFDALGVPYTPARWAVDDNPPTGSPEWAEKQAKVFQLINAYRVRGHLIADLDPLRQQKPKMYPELDPLYYGLTIWDLDREFATGGIAGVQVMPLGKILSALRDAYCRTAGIEYMHIQQTEQKRWIQQRVEEPRTELGREEKVRILSKLDQAEAFEKFLHTKYVGHKRFGLEGSESLVPMLDAVLSAAAGDGIEEAVIGMSHRGRLNVLANIIGKSYGRIFREFEGDIDPSSTGGSGDVKYHLGAEGTFDSANGPIAVGVVANPSHLEAVDPVLEGVVRAKQERRGEEGHHRVLPVLIHGDAAFAGQGVVVETFNLSQLRGYRTGGTVHIVINNQVGFTTSTLDARSSFYATDVAKTVQAPIIHVNGDDPEAVVRVARFAFAYRQAFNKDVVIDMICYRRRGHNEGDEPSYTQPIMYKLIETHPSVRRLYLERLVSAGDVSPEEVQALSAEFHAAMDQAFGETRDSHPAPTPTPPLDVEGREPVTAVGRDELESILEYVTTPPDGFVIHPKLEKLVEDRRRALAADSVDWATAEALAFGSLARQGVPIRLAGEDSRRGTFSHRHAELTDYETAEEWIPLQALTEDATRVRIVDSLLSEFAAVGFEYGYSVEWPEVLVMWEAQFGDFANGAQVIVDQFIAPGETKWSQPSGLTLLLPHGFEGQGPEHSSARIERYLELCAGDNMRVVVPATSGQYFHLLRRQALLEPRKPLIVFTPKSLLRTRASFATTEILTAGRYQPLFEDVEVESGAERVVLCAGKVYHDLIRSRQETGVEGVAVVRVSQLYPVPEDELALVASAHPGAELVWCQEEPENMGAYRFLWHPLRRIFGREPRYAGRRSGASPATGSAKVHQREQDELVIAALT